MAHPAFSQQLSDMIEPGSILVSSARHFAVVFFDTVFRRGEILAPILRMSQIRSEAFAKFWIEFSGARSPEAATEAEPVGSNALLPPLLATAKGVILDIGPGTGTQTPLFTNPGIKVIYGAEPTQDLHADLQAKAERCGKSSTYKILHCGAQPQSLVPALDKAGFEDLASGVFDTIVCVRVLCSVPNPDDTIRGLYQLLKPGGKMLVAEHVANPWYAKNGSVLGRLAQIFYTLLGWPFFVGDCQLGRNTRKSLVMAAAKDGGWETDTLELSFGWSAIPYISGTLVKRG
ncbi:hypothetical protein LOZ57_001053 [Ophidiomyces ophidiicola]|uniref:uncharacterized protein n=1 Tax=Ophidiomyces ophidiicola TaxID=1387563 RepID=UPI0020C4E09E|nr:uncharacterized protein LOZ57_001053 [Ophidiomyces ophidiicola]KAI1952969.1 hypothetical protein LOZ57_001053 [Ophidiomyces ophidiicola]